jgi:uncharacterized lipoprotein YmbA
MTPDYWNQESDARTRRRLRGAAKRDGTRVNVLAAHLGLAGVFLLAFAGCSLLPEPQADATRFFVLSTSAAGTPVSASGNAPVVHVRSVELASYIRGRPLIVRRGDNEIEFRDFARWGEPLEAGIARVLREELLARGAARAVVIPGVRAAGPTATFDLSLRVLACEGESDGGVNFRVVWQLSFADAKSVVAARGDFRPSDLKWDGKNEASLAAQLSRAVAGLAAEIAAALEKQR